jgi:chromosomal replication initiator protein
LLADIQPPDAEHRMAILRAKAVVLGAQIADRELEAIAQPECASVRELEGSLNRVLAYAAMMGSAVDQDIVARALGPLRSGPRQEVTSERVLAAVTKHFEVTPEALRGKARDHAVAWPRQMAMYLMREATTLSLSQIGESLGGRDHTTVMHGCSHVAAEVKAKAHIRQDVDDLLADVRG